MATGTPPGIITVESRASAPFKGPPSIGTPMTGRVVCAATAPAKCAAKPAAQMKTPQSRATASATYSAVACGVRWADVTRTSNRTESESSTCAQACIVGQSDSEPINTATHAIVSSYSGHP